MLNDATALNPNLRKYFGRTKMDLEKSVHDITNLDYPSHSRRCTCKIPVGNNIIRRPLQKI